MWEYLKEIYQGKEICQLLSLMKELIYTNLLLERDKIMKEYIHDII